jgi:hypothetical protein
MKNSIIQYYVREVYGNPRYYVADKALADSISKLTGQKTIMPWHMAALEALGFKMERVLQPELVTKN